MWLCCNDGFLSVVSDQQDPARLMVRARRKQDLLNICGNDAKVIEGAGSDYRWRTFVDRKAFSALIAARIDNIDYPNFKNSVADGPLHHLYMDFWVLHRHYQDAPQSARTPRQTGTTKPKS